ncbi:fasciclin domain-containing protein (plasmid) [Roseomonas sp. CCTCC AB2023176]|uniref:fasciclin domain-containing protein n=1 Tax=Roseomonas sp. CCTCC AB2023176 TaxID=3342640 RepID=UPI0035E1F6F4
MTYMLPLGILLAGALNVGVSTTARAQTVVDVLRQQADMGIFATLVERSGLAEQLSGSGPFSLYVPTDSDFGRLSFEMRSMLVAEANRDAVRRFVLSHVTMRARSLDYTSGYNEFVANSLAGNQIRFVREQAEGDGANGGSITANGIPVEGNIRATNGYIHRIGGFLAD